MSMTFMRFPNGKAKALTLSYDDGVEQDEKLVAIMDAHGLKGTFNLNSGLYTKEGTTFAPGTIHRRMTEDHITRLFEHSNHEVAVHTATHPFLEQLSEDRCAYEVLKDREKLESQFHRIVKGMAYPFGTYSDSVTETLKKAGICYSRTVLSTGDFRLPTDWLKLTATCHHNDENLMPLAQKFVCETPNRQSWLFYLWGHSYEFEQNDNWQVIEAFSAYIGGKEDIWYATNMEIYDYITAYNQLQYSAQGDRVHNPTAVTLYMQNGENIVEIPAGKTCCIN